jgi:hypothetical protein
MAAAQARTRRLCSCTHTLLGTGMTIELQGLSKQQYQLAELLWNCDTQAAVDQLKRSLPAAHKRDAETVHQLMIAAVMDGYDDVTDDVRAVIDSLRYGR